MLLTAASKRMFWRASAASRSSRLRMRATSVGDVLVGDDPADPICSDERDRIMRSRTDHFVASGR